MVDDGLFHARVERSGISDAGRAAVGGKSEAESFQERQQAGALQVLGNDARSRRQRSLDVRFHREASFHRFPGEQTGGEEYARIGRVCAGRDSGDQHVAMA